MAGVPEFCEQCGRQAEYPMVHVEEFASDVTFVDVTGECTYCGGRTRVIEGTFDFRDGIIEMLSGPRWSRERLRQLQSAVVEARRLAPTDAAAAIARVEQADPRTASLLRRVLASKELVGLMAVLAVLASVVSIVVTIYLAGADEVTPEDVQRIVDRTIEQLEPLPSSDQRPPVDARGPEQPGPGKLER